MIHIIIIITCLSIFQNVNGFDNIILKDDNLKDYKQERRFPNGTVIGKYLYTDNQGNPVHVKYFADGGSYGVELKSVKVEVSSPTGELLSSNKEYNNKSDNIIFKSKFLSPYSTQPYMYGSLQRMYDEGEQKYMKSNRNKRKSRKFV